MFNQEKVEQNHVVLENLFEKPIKNKPVTLTWKNIVVNAPIKPYAQKFADIFKKKNDDFVALDQKIIINNGKIILEEIT